MVDDIRYITATIENNDDESDEVQLLPVHGRLVGLITDAVFVAADVTFEVSVDGTNFFPLYDESNEYTISADADQYHRVDTNIFFGVRYLTLHTSVAQNAGDTDIALVMWEI